MVVNNLMSLDERKKLGMAIRKIRLERGVTQVELCKNIKGMSAKYFSDVERGERNISFDNICKIAKGLEVKVSSLFSQ